MLKIIGTLVLVLASTCACAETKQVLVMGGDGFCGWPTALYLSDLGYNVGIIDNLSRRAIDLELGLESLTPIASIETRLEVWEKLKGKKISFYNVDIAKNYDELIEALKEFRPDVIVHFAEQRSAPYSMKSAKTRRYTVDNNLNTTNNILSAIVDLLPDTHLVHLGTMGVYGYKNFDDIIPEGYLKITTKSGEEREILHPFDPGSIYHMTKCQDSILFYYYNKNYGLKVTDLHQGVVWGTNTDQTLLDEALINRYDYDSDYGTILNRFLVQAAIGHPLTVYGTGGQTRAFIHIRDVVQCIRIAVENPPNKGERVKIFNQMTETHRVIDLAQKVQAIWNSDITNIDNPRKEASSNTLRVSNRSFLDLQLNPITLTEGLLYEVVEVAKRYAHRVDKTKILPVSFWEVKKE